MNTHLSICIPQSLKTAFEKQALKTGAPSLSYIHRRLMESWINGEISLIENFTAKRKKSKAVASDGTNAGRGTSRGH